LTRAEQQRAAQQYAAAQQSYAAFLEAAPTHPNASLIATRIGDVFQEQQQTRQALEAYARVVKDYPGSEGALISQMHLAEIGVASPELLPTTSEPEYAAYRQPVDSLQRLVKEYPFSPLADMTRVKIGEIFLKQQQVSAAVDLLQQVLKQPLQADIRREAQIALLKALVQQFAAQERQGAFAEILQTFFRHKPTLSLDTIAQPDLLLPVVRSYAHLGLVDEAYSVLQILLSRPLPPEHKEAVVLEQARLLARHGQDKAVITALTPLAQFPDPEKRGQALLLLAESAWHLQRPEEAGRYGHLGETLLSAPSDQARLLLVLGQADAAQGKPDQGIHRLQQCADLTTSGDKPAPVPAAAMCLRHAATLSMAQRQPQQALSAYERLLQRFPSQQGREQVLLQMADLQRQLHDEPGMRATLNQLRASTSDPIWQKIATEALDNAEWQKRFPERLAKFHNAVVK
jgi:tetratricopeptide (TPR) repeat protein